MEPKRESPKPSGTKVLLIGAASFLLGNLTAPLLDRLGVGLRDFIFRTTPPKLQFVFARGSSEF
jgi:hypothetical protein